MEADFWHARWEAGKIGFHETGGNRLLARHLPVLGLAPGARVFVPLSGKTRDIAALLSAGYRVVACELNRSAIDQLFAEMDVSPNVTETDGGWHYTAPDLDVFVGDVFALTAAQIGPVDAVYDRAAVIALPETTRTAYAAHMDVLCARAPQLVITLSYDQSLTDGPPFSVDATEMQRLYGDRYDLTALETVGTSLKSVAEVDETIWHLSPAPDA